MYDKHYFSVNAKKSRVAVIIFVKIMQSLFSGRKICQLQPIDLLANFLIVNGEIIPLNVLPDVF
jgi:hypothetical protein